MGREVSNRRFPFLVTDSPPACGAQGLGAYLHTVHWVATPGVSQAELPHGRFPLGTPT